MSVAARRRRTSTVTTDNNPVGKAVGKVRDSMVSMLVVVPDKLPAATLGESRLAVAQPS